MSEPVVVSGPAPEVSEPALVVVRHGATEWSQNGRHTSRTDLPLLPEGRERARELRELFEGLNFGRVLCSPLLRARETCELAGFGERMEICPDLTEWDYGDYEGLTSPQIHEQDPDWSLWRDGCPGGESPAQVATRVDRVIEFAVRGGADADRAPARVAGAAGAGAAGGGLAQGGGGTGGGNTGGGLAQGGGNTGGGVAQGGGGTGGGLAQGGGNTGGGVAQGGGGTGGGVAQGGGNTGGGVAGVGDTIAFAHGHVLRVLSARWIGLAAAGGERFALAPAGIAKLGHEHTTRVIERWNTTSL